jgi:DNA-binding HxlR family transcriptional regulator
VRDRRSLLIARDLLLPGRLRFRDFVFMVGQGSISTNTLAARLRRLRGSAMTGEH